MVNVMNDRLLTVKEAAAYLHLDPTTVYKMLQARKLPGKKIGQSWRCRKDELEDFASGVVVSDPSNPKEPDHAQEGAA